VKYFYFFEILDYELACASKNQQTTAALLLLFHRAGVQPTLDPYAEAFFVTGPLR